MLGRPHVEQRNRSRRDSQRLSAVAKERVVYVLREAFEYSPRRSPRCSPHQSTAHIYRRPILTGRRPRGGDRDAPRRKIARSSSPRHSEAEPTHCELLTTTRSHLRVRRGRSAPRPITAPAVRVSATLYRARPSGGSAVGYLVRPVANAHRACDVSSTGSPFFVTVTARHAAFKPLTPALERATAPVGLNPHTGNRHRRLVIRQTTAVRFPRHGVRSGRHTQGESLKTARRPGRIRRGQRRLVAWPSGCTRATDITRQAYPIRDASHAPARDRPVPEPRTLTRSRHGVHVRSRRSPP